MELQKDDLAKSVVSHMMENDFFSQWMNVQLLEVTDLRLIIVSHYFPAWQKKRVSVLW